MIQEIKVVTRLQDCGDGGYTMYAYNNEDELIADHPLSRNGKMTEKLKKEILTEHDPYENGYIGEDTIEIETLQDGTLRLVNPISFHAGQ